MPSSDADAPRRRLPAFSKVAGAVAGLVTLAGGVTALVFTFEPNARPCLGASKAAISASVFPGEHRREYLIRSGASVDDANSVPDQLGAVIRYTIDADGYRHRPLAIAYTLFSVGRDDTLGPVVGSDRVPHKIFRPATCSDQGGYDAFVAIPAGRQRYLILLELFRDEALTERISLFESAPFRD